MNGAIQSVNVNEHDLLISIDSQNVFHIFHINIPIDFVDLFDSYVISICVFSMHQYSNKMHYILHSCIEKIVFKRENK